MNTAIASCEEEHNIKFQEIAAQVIEARLRLAYLEQRMIDAYVFTTAYRLEEEQKDLLRYYWDDEG